MIRLAGKMCSHSVASGSNAITSPFIKKNLVIITHR